VKAKIAVYGTLVCLRVDDGGKMLLRLGELQVLEVDGDGLFLKFKDGFYVSYKWGEFSIIYPSSYASFKHWCAEGEEEIAEKLKLASKIEENKG